MVWVGLEVAMEGGMRAAVRELGAREVEGGTQAEGEREGTMGPLAVEEVQMARVERVKVEPGAGRTGSVGQGREEGY